MPEDEKLSPATSGDVAQSIAFALLFSGKKRIHDSDRMTAAIAADHIVRHLEQCRFVVMKQPPLGGSARHESAPRTRAMREKRRYIFGLHFRLISKPIVSASREVNPRIFVTSPCTLPSRTGQRSTAVGRRDSRIR